MRGAKGRSKWQRARSGARLKGLPYRLQSQRGLDEARRAFRWVHIGNTAKAVPSSERIGQ